ncbi:MAG: DUF349 domain-containing protein [Tetrasphaera sp.]
MSDTPTPPAADADPQPTAPAADAEFAVDQSSVAAPEERLANSEPVEPEPKPVAGDMEAVAEVSEPEGVEPEPVAEVAEVVEPAAPEPVAEQPASHAVPMPSPAMFAARPKPAATPAAPALPRSDSARFGRVGEDGTVYVTGAEGERAVGSYPGATADEALQYFARKYDELFATADLLHQRAVVPEVASKDLADGLKAVREHAAGANVVGDLAALDALLTSIETEVAAKREAETQARQQAKAEAMTVREALVVEAERIAAQPPERVQWKSSGEAMRALLDQWKDQQRGRVRLDKEAEAALWQRFSRARNSFDKARRAHFADLEATRSSARAAKERLVKEAEALAASKDWAATAGAFKRLMDQWRQAGRASRSEDDALWERFKAAQDSFFAAKDAVVAAEDAEFRANLEVKLGLLAEAERLLPITNLDAAKAALRTIQDKWEHAGKVPRADIDRTEKGLRRIEGAIRDAEEKKWRRTNPEVASRAHSLATQLEASVEKLEKQLAAAESAGNTKQVADLTAKLAAQRSWLEQARGGLAEFSG